MSDTPCICGHSESMHFAVSGACMKVITKNPSVMRGNIDYCACRKYRPEPTLPSRENSDG